ncbi:hypothetical protein HAX54_015406, partial [Datura stramonium]|nr:hypothetical protein [Datura stramonium]
MTRLTNYHGLDGESEGHQSGDVPFTGVSHVRRRDHRRTAVWTIIRCFKVYGLMVDLTGHRRSDRPSLLLLEGGIELVMLFKGDGGFHGPSG